MMACKDFALDRAAFLAWSNADGEENTADLDRVRKAVPTILAEYVTPVQRDYIVLYFAEQMSVREIAALREVSGSTVSRTIRRGLDRMYRCLRFSAPGFNDASRGRLKNGRRRTKHE